MAGKSFVFRFDDVEVREREFTLIKSGKVLTVEPKAFRALLFLLHNSPKLISKEELLNSVWGDAVVTEGSLTRCIWLLRSLLGDDIRNPRYIETVATVGYRFVCKVEVSEDASGTSDASGQSDGSGTLAGKPPVVRSTRRPWVWAGAALVVVAMAYVTWFFRGGSRKPAAAPELAPLTSYTGFERSPSFSPDGNQVAFSWDGEKQDNFDIYVKLVGSPAPLRLTTDPADDLSPAFSPDGRSIGFVRVSKERAAFIVIPAIGGPERLVAEVVPDPLYALGPAFAWFPDGRWIVTNGLTLLSTESGETRSLTSPPMKSLPDFSPAVSLDGSAIAFSRSTGWSVSDIYLLDLDEDLKPKREPRRLTSLKRNSYSPAWTPNGWEIIFASGVFFSPGLWRVSTSGSGEPEQLPFTGEASWPAISRSGNRLAYQWDVSDRNIWRLSLSVS